MKLSLGMAVVVAGFLVTAASEAARAADRAAVIVLSYNDDWVSTVGEGIYRISMENMLSDRYSPIEYVWGRDIDELAIPNALTAALNSGKPVDIFFSTHSNQEEIFVFNGGGLLGLRPEIMLSWAITDQNRWQLGTAINFGCYGDAQKGQFAGLGFKSFAGFDDVSAGALALQDFMKHWTNCESLSESISATNYSQQRLLVDSDIGRAMFSRITGGMGYQAELHGYGADARLCEPGGGAQGSPWPY